MTCLCADNEGVVKSQKANRKGVIRLNTIKDIIEQVRRVGSRI